MLGKPRIRLPDAEGQRITVEGAIRTIETKTDNLGKTKRVLRIDDITFRGAAFSEYNVNSISDTLSRLFLPGAVCATVEDVGEKPEKRLIMGERIMVTGIMKTFRRARNQGGFDEEGYHYACGDAFAMDACKVVTRDGNGNRFMQDIQDLKEALANRIEMICDEDAGLMRALLLGDKSGLSDGLKSLYRDGAILHVLSVSGLHISFWGAGLYMLFRKMLLPLILAASAAGTFLVLYCIMTGMSPSAFRASVMFLCTLTADAIHRSYDRLTALSFSAMLLCTAKPYILFHSGFLLSYGAILGITIFLPIITEHFPGKAAKLLGASLSVQIVTLPVILTAYFSVPVYGVFLNLLVVPLMSLVMGGGMLALAVGLIWLPVAKMLFIPVHLILSGIAFVCQMTENLPLNSWNAGIPSIANVIRYAVMLVFIAWSADFVGRKYLVLSYLCALSFLTWNVPDALSITMIDVGQGQSVAVSADGNHHYLIDGGSTSEKELARYTLIPYLQSQGISYLDAVFISHTDADHYSGIEEMLLQGKDCKVRIGSLVMPAIGDRDEKYMELCQLAHKTEIPVYVMGRGNAIMEGDLSLTCLHPQPGSCFDDKNSGSLVLAIAQGDFCMLDMGDCDAKGEEEIISQLVDIKRNMDRNAVGRHSPFAHSDILAAGHHGSKTSSSEAFLHAIRPIDTLISVGERNRYGHPAPEVLTRLLEVDSNIHMTKEGGALTVHVTPDGAYTISHYIS
ncbi:MAG: DNA internalization-related competence protein ComEC/Rec2 [Lachnospiraceae bacterium]|nr:DNA internalization-related competence protein ComEC/Rec2 [Lachnospiraceae bacterium]